MVEAAKWLVENSSLFQNEGIVLNESWLHQPHELQYQSEQRRSTTEQSNETSDNWSEEDICDNRPSGNLDTCLQSVDLDVIR